MGVVSKLWSWVETYSNLFTSHTRELSVNSVWLNVTSIAYLLTVDSTATPTPEEDLAPSGYIVALFATLAADIETLPNIKKQNANIKDNIRFIPSSAFLLDFASSPAYAGASPKGKPSAFPFGEGVTE